MRAIVLSAGYGTRLGDLTLDTPKPMLLLEGRPLLEYIIHNLALHGFNQIAINIHFMPEVIQKYFGDGSRFGVELIYSHEKELLGTAGGVKKMANFLCQGEAFLIHYGDILTNQDLTAMLNFHRQKQALATLLLHKRAKSNSVVALDDEAHIIEFLERPDEKNMLRVNSPWVNSGITICSPRLLDFIPNNEVCDLPRDIYPKLISDGRLFGFPLSGYRCAIDSPERLAEARAAIASKCNKFL